MEEGRRSMQGLKAIAHKIAAFSLTASVIWAGSSLAHGSDHADEVGAPLASYRTAMQTMNQDLSTMPSSGDADRDFASLMARHHQAAIDVARVELQYGRDPEMRRTAQQVIQKQQQEISDLRTWLARQPSR